MTSPAYLDLAAFRDLSSMPGPDIDALETLAPGWIEAQLLRFSRRIDAQVGKQYARPFVEPYPEVVTGWLADIVTWRAYRKRGVDPNDQAMVDARADFDQAIAEIAQAADAEKGLFELPLTAASDAQAITRSKPLAYTETSPYVWRNMQADEALDEDASGSGTYG